MSNEIITPVGRMVQGHPMVLHPVCDRHGVQKINKRGEPQMQAFVALAIAKGTETDWRQTDWGAKIQSAGQTGWPTGEWQAPTFAWKITDGDSRVPNRKGKLPCDNEGFPGHWIISATSGFAPDCFANGVYTSQVMMKETFKTGDYIRLVLTARGNDSHDSPGVYVNLIGCELIQAGVAIQSASLDATATFGAQAATMPAGALVDPNVTGATGATQPTEAAASYVAPQTDVPAASSAGVVTGEVTPPPPAQTIDPAYDFLMVNGKQFNVKQLRDAKWTEEQIVAAR